MTESEVPTLGLGAEQRQMWTQAVMTMAYGVRERRHALGRVAWSDEQTAERTHERTERIADPAVRAMSVDEWTEAVDRRQRGQGGERHTHSGDGWVTVWIGPLDGGRTALLASAGPPGSTTPTATAAVSCADTATAVELADDLLAGGPDQVDRLHAFATLSARRAAAAANDVAEPEPARLARTAAAVRQVWTGPRYTALAEAVVASPAFPALAWRLHELAERGYAVRRCPRPHRPRPADRRHGPRSRRAGRVVRRADGARPARDQPRRGRPGHRRPGRRCRPDRGRRPHRRARTHPAPDTAGIGCGHRGGHTRPRRRGARRHPHGPSVRAAGGRRRGGRSGGRGGAAAHRGLPGGAGAAAAAQPRLSPAAGAAASAAPAGPAGREDARRPYRPRGWRPPGIRRATCPPRCTAIPLTAPLRPTGPDRAAMADLVRTAMPDTVADKVVALPRLAGAGPASRGVDRRGVTGRGSARRPAGRAGVPGPHPRGLHGAPDGPQGGRAPDRCAGRARRPDPSRHSESPVAGRGERRAQRRPGGGRRRRGHPRVGRRRVRTPPGRTLPGRAARRGPAPTAAGCRNPRPPTLRRCSTTRTSTCSTTSTASAPTSASGPAQAHRTRTGRPGITAHPPTHPAGAAARALRGDPGRAPTSRG